MQDKVIETNVNLLSIAPMNSALLRAFRYSGIDEVKRKVQALKNISTNIEGIVKRSEKFFKVDCKNKKREQ